MMLIFDFTDMAKAKDISDLNRQNIQAGSGGQIQGTIITYEYLASNISISDMAKAIDVSDLKLDKVNMLMQPRPYAKYKA